MSTVRAVVSGSSFPSLTVLEKKEFPHLVLHQISRAPVNALSVRGWNEFGINDYLVQPICDKIWLNCAFYDTSMKFGTHIEYIITKIFGYRAISDFAMEVVGSHFKNGRRKPISSI